MIFSSVLGSRSWPLFLETASKAVKHVNCVYLHLKDGLELTLVSVVLTSSAASVGALASAAEIGYLLEGIHDDILVFG